MQRYNRGSHKLETQTEIQNDQWGYWWDYYDDYSYSYYEEPWSIHYEYVKNLNEETIFQRRGLITSQYKRPPSGVMIDMESIYSKEMLRQRKIDKILGEIKDLSNTIENILQERGIKL